MKKYRKAVSALVLRPVEVCSTDGCKTVHEMLLVHKPRIHDAWQLPQGGIEAGETPDQAAVRELQEETGLHLPSVTHVCESTYRYDFPPQFIAKYNPINSGQELAFVMFRVTEKLPVIVDNKEVDNHVWILPEQLPLYIKRPEYVEVIQRVLEECKDHLGKSEEPNTKSETNSKY